MKRPVAILVGVLVVIGVTATAALAVVAALPGEHRFGPGMHRLSQRVDGPGQGGPRGLTMPGAVRVGSEAEYLASMVAHHEEAVEAAGQLARSDRPELRDLGEAIIASQTRQIDQMRVWLARWYPDGVDVHHEPMMRDLSGLSGAALDRAFLVDMIPHHMTAVMMSQQLLLRGLAEHDEVASLAADIRDEQHAEIFTMRQWLADWFDLRGPGHGRTGMGPGMPGHGGWMHASRWEADGHAWRDRQGAGRDGQGWWREGRTPQDVRPGRPAMGRCLGGDWLR